MAAGAGRGVRQGGDYYSLDAVLAEETLIPCMFKVGSRGVGRALDPSSGSEDVKPRAAVELPLWMLQPLTSRDMLSVKCEPALCLLYSMLGSAAVRWPSCQMSTCLLLQYTEQCFDLWWGKDMTLSRTFPC